MGIDLYWDDDNLTTLLCVFDGRWTWDELYKTLQTVKRITDDVEHEVSAIIDMRKGLQFPGGSIFNAQGLEFAKQVLKMSDGKSGPMVIVGANRMVRSAHDTMSGFNRSSVSKVFFTDTVQQARDHLDAMRIERTA